MRLNCVPTYFIVFLSGFRVVVFEIFIFASALQIIGHFKALNRRGRSLIGVIGHLVIRRINVLITESELNFAKFPMVAVRSVRWS